MFQKSAWNDPAALQNELRLGTRQQGAELERPAGCRESKGHAGSPAQPATLREIADEAGVSVGLLYCYFPSRQAVVVALYDQLSMEFARRATAMNAGTWRTRFVFALDGLLGDALFGEPATT